MLRYAAYFASLVMTLVCAGLMSANPEWRWGLAVFGLLSVLGTWDLLQTRSTLRRNYPILAHFRYGLESIGPEIRQYFIESDTDETAVLARSSARSSTSAPRTCCDVRPFGTAARRVRRATTNGSTIRSRRADIAIARFPRRDRRPQCAQPYSRQRVQHLGDEFRLAVGQCDPRAQRRRAARRLLPRHRRRLDLALPPRERRRPGLGDRLGLLRLPRRRRQLQRGALRRQRARSRR